MYPFSRKGSDGFSCHGGAARGEGVPDEPRLEAFRFGTF